MYAKTFRAGPLGGVGYLDFMHELAAVLKPRSYLEIGTNNGASLSQVSCDALCIDPNFQVSWNVLNRRRSFFFQLTADEFFQDHDVKSFFPAGVDLSFLDGLHHFEATLRDFINVERVTHSRSVVLIHDCLPFNLEMASRAVRPLMWAGDVWRLLPILKKYRPDLRIPALDCEPTGLIVCTGLDPRSTVLSDNYYAIIDEFLADDLSLDRLEEVGALFPYLDSRRLVSQPADLAALMG